MTKGETEQGSIDFHQVFWYQVQWKTMDSVPNNVQGGACIWAKRFEWAH